MVAFRKKKEPTAEGLLSKKRGLFGRSKPKNTSSDERPRHASPFGRVFRAKNKEAEADAPDYEVPTPPMTPASPAPPEVVTPAPSQALVIRKVDTPSPLRNIEVTRRGQYREDHTVVSDLTYPREMQQQHAQYEMETAEHMRKELESRQLRQRERQERQQSVATPTTEISSTTKEQQTPPNQHVGVISRMLGMVEMTCVSTFQGIANESAEDAIRKQLSFAPEWGMAPTMADDDDETRSFSTYDDTRTGTDTYTRTTHRTGPNDSGFFEMVLLEEEPQPQSRAKSPKRPRKVSAPSKDYDDDAYTNSRLEGSDDIFGIAKRDVSEFFTAFFPDEEEKKDDSVLTPRRVKHAEQPIKPPVPAPVPAPVRAPAPAPVRAPVPERERAKSPTESIPSTAPPPLVARPKTPAPRATSPKSVRPQPTVAASPPPAQEEQEVGHETTWEANFDEQRVVPKPNPEKKSRSIPNPAAVLIRKARNARERKKQADKEKKYKSILMSLQNKNDGGLPTVEEEANENSPPSSSPVQKSEPVIVPKVQSAAKQVKVKEPDKPVKQKEVVNKSVVNKSVVNKSVVNKPVVNKPVVNKPVVNKPVVNKPVVNKPVVNKPVNDDASTVSKYSANELLGAQHMPTEDIMTLAPDIAKSPSWMEVLGLKKTNDAVDAKVTKAVSDPGVTTIHHSVAALVESVKKAQDDSYINFGKDDKPIWKEVKDPSSGKSYYYHRETRETTWTRPPEHLIVKKKMRSMTELEKEIKAIISNNMPETEDKETISKRKELARLLVAMAPPNTETIEKLVAEFAGREDELVRQLKTVNEAKPFDEPVDKPNEKEEEEEDDDQPHSRAIPMAGRARSIAGRTVVTAASGVSGKSKISEQTPQIRNTGKERPSLVDAIQESEAESDISESGQLMRGRKLVAPSHRPPLSRHVPSNVPVPRRRDLKVEEYATDRIAAETYDTRRARPLRLSMRNRHGSPSYFQFDSSYMGDSEDTSRGNETDSQANTTIPDSISALSEPEYKPNDIYGSRRKALHDAIANEDWDLAATLSEKLQSLQGTKSAHKQTGREWTQSELDKFISQNDWDAVTDYIAQVRNKRSKPKGRSKYDSFEPPSGRVKKRFGARSQLQHSDLHSVSSWETSSSSGEDVSSDDTESTDDRRFRYRRQLRVG